MNSSQKHYASRENLSELGNGTIWVHNEMCQTKYLHKISGKNKVQGCCKMDSRREGSNVSTETIADTLNHCMISDWLQARRAEQLACKPELSLIISMTG